MWKTEGPEGWNAIGPMVTLANDVHTADGEVVALTAASQLSAQN